MEPGRYRKLSVKPELYEKLESIRKELGARSVAEVVGLLTAFYPEYKVLKQRQEKQAPVPRAR